jgi:hypothetical protein
VHQYVVKEVRIKVRKVRFDAESSPDHGRADNDIEQNAPRIGVLPKVLVKIIPRLDPLPACH